jgi:hypothetical protein
MFKRSGTTWAELNDRQRGWIRLLAIIQIALLMVALADIRGRAPAEINGSQRVWIGVMFINVIGPLAYFGFGRKRVRAS